MGAANLDKMVEKNGDLLKCVGGGKYWKCVGEEEKNGEWLGVKEDVIGLQTPVLKAGSR